MKFTLYKLLLLITFFSVTACSSTDTGMKYAKKSPRGISVINVKKGEQAKAYRAAEIHCAKYYKVPRILKVKNQEQNEFTMPMRTISFECLKPSN